MLECSRADTGVGPSIAEGSQGCRPNCADFPMAAASSPSMGMVCGVSYWDISSCRLMEEEVNSQAVVMIRPISPIRL